MKTTLDLSDELLRRAKSQARKTGKTLRSLVEEGLRLALNEPTGPRFVLPDRSVGDNKSKNPLDAVSWQDLRDEIYGGR